ncbi:hypothetical protein D3C73_1389180 [compost metagenome]
MHQFVQRQVQVAELLQLRAQQVALDAKQATTGKATKLASRAPFAQDALLAQHFTRPHAPGLDKALSVVDRHRDHAGADDHQAIGYRVECQQNFIGLVVHGAHVVGQTVAVFDAE